MPIWIQSLILVCNLLIATRAQADVEKPVTNLVIQNKINVSGDWMGIGFGSLWEASGGTLYRVNGDDNSIQAKIPVGPGGYRGIAIGEKYVFVPAAGDQKLYKVDPDLNQVVGSLSLSFQGTEASVGVGAGSVWIVTLDSTSGSELSRVDIDTMAVVSKTKLPGYCAGVVFAFDSAWLSCPQLNQVVRVDAHSAQVISSITTHASPRFITANSDSVWVLNQGDGSIQRLDPTTSSVSATIDAKLSGGGGDIASGEGAIWVTMPGKPVNKIDPLTNSLTASFVGSGGMGDAIRAGLGSVWVSGGQLHRIQVP